MIYSREKRLNESSFDKTELQYDPGPGVMAESNPLLLESPILFQSYSKTKIRKMFILLLRLLSFQPYCGIILRSRCIVRTWTRHIRAEGVLNRNLLSKCKFLLLLIAKRYNFKGTWARRITHFHCHSTTLRKTCLSEDKNNKNVLKHISKMSHK